MRYIKLTLKHKWFVFLACLRLGGIPWWRAILHDVSKFRPVEFWPYNRYLAGDRSDPAGLARALLHHWNANPHHYQYWLDRPDHSEHYRQMFAQSGLVQDGVFEMPETYAREMVADWLGATRVHTGSWDMSDFLKANLPLMKLHPRTRQYVISILKELGYAEASEWG
jgi:hypothetical protein